jgi:hypothetical protein
VTTRWSRSSADRPATSDVAAIAPALIMGFSGRPVSGARLIELNASPVGSTPIVESTASCRTSSSASPYTNGFEIDWIVNGWRVSPTS